MTNEAYKQIGFSLERDYHYWLTNCQTGGLDACLEASNTFKAIAFKMDTALNTIVGTPENALVNFLTQDFLPAFPHAAPMEASHTDSPPQGRSAAPALGKTPPNNSNIPVPHRPATNDIPANRSSIAPNNTPTPPPQEGSTPALHSPEEQPFTKTALSPQDQPNYQKQDKEALKQAAVAAKFAPKPPENTVLTQSEKQAAIAKSKRSASVLPIFEVAAEKQAAVSEFKPVLSLADWANRVNIPVAAETPLEAANEPRIHPQKEGSDFFGSGEAETVTEYRQTADVAKWDQEANNAAPRPREAEYLPEQNYAHQRRPSPPAAYPAERLWTDDISQFSEHHHQPLTDMSASPPPQNLFKNAAPATQTEDLIAALSKHLTEEYRRYYGYQ